MCGRYVIDEDMEIEEMNKILLELKKNYSNTAEYKNIRRGEIFPGNFAPVIIPAPNNKINVAPIKWGVEYPQNKNLIINARAEGVATRPMFRTAIKKGRCIIPTNGFYEWKKTDGNKKVKYLIRKSSAPMLYLAGICDVYRDYKTGGESVRFVIVTREALGVIRHIHGRMPVAIEKRDILMWLNGNDAQVDELINTEVPEYELKAV